MKTFGIFTLGCKVNQYDAGDLANALRAAGWQTTERPAVAIINTCAVTKGAIAKNKKMIARVKAESPDAKIVVVGCWPRVAEIKAAIDGVDLVLTSKDMTANAAAINELIGQSAQLNICADSLKPIDHARYFLKIQDGCRQFCSYCIIPYTRGELSSRPYLEVLAEAAAAARRGYEEIVLCGIHLGLYGADIRTGEAVNLVDLLKALIEIPDLKRIRLSSIEITEVSDELIVLLGAESKLCPHLHISLQSGCDKILKLMKRPYTADFFLKRLTSLRRVVPDIAITTDVIVGFPGESDEDFAATRQFVRQAAFSRLHVFPFSAHELTPAFRMPNRSSPRVIRDRAVNLRAVSKILAADFRKKFVGREVWGIVIGQKNGLWLIKTDYYFDCLLLPGQLPDSQFKIGHLVKISC